MERGLAVEVLDNAVWWRRLGHLSYLHHSQHLLLGHQAWIISHMEKRQTRDLTSESKDPAIRSRRCLFGPQKRSWNTIKLHHSATVFDEKRVIMK
ncbi:hypothetical protein Pmani_016511 [Petrolisthes manimaculis]|uniref:Uncharacterized protein n=1 Tax=Petrolisthes manimaculis TaxID=1843537 RepID=A0AAE1U6B0_9EUCA|nr:hypothetical protein Pmani_016511 [Petrolisthes manimaculis]